MMLENEEQSRHFLDFWMKCIDDGDGMDTGGLYHDGSFEVAGSHDN